MAKSILILSLLKCCREQLVVGIVQISIKQERFKVSDFMQVITAILTAFSCCFICLFQNSRKSPCFLILKNLPPKDAAFPAKAFASS